MSNKFIKDPFSDDVIENLSVEEIDIFDKTFVNVMQGLASRLKIDTRGYGAATKMAHSAAYQTILTRREIIVPLKD